MGKNDTCTSLRHHLRPAGSDDSEIFLTRFFFFLSLYLTFGCRGISSSVAFLVRTFFVYLKEELKEKVLFVLYCIRSATSVHT